MLDKYDMFKCRHSRASDLVPAHARSLLLCAETTAPGPEPAGTAKVLPTRPTLATPATLRTKRKIRSIRFNPPPTPRKSCPAHPAPVDIPFLRLEGRGELAPAQTLDPRKPLQRNQRNQRNRFDRPRKSQTFSKDRPSMRVSQQGSSHYQIPPPFCLLPSASSLRLRYTEMDQWLDSDS